MSITGKQLLAALQYAVSCNNGGLTGPIATFTANPSSYTTVNIPIGVTLSGVITLNDAIISIWNIKQGNTILATGSSLNPTFFVTPPEIITTVYTLEVYYTLNGVSGLLTLNVTVLVTAGALYGHLLGPSDNITVPADLTAPIIATLTVSNQANLEILFPIVVTVVSRFVFVIPYAFGADWVILDNDNLSVMSEFSLVDDPGNTQMIAVSNNPVIPGTYQFQISFA